MTPARVDPAAPPALVTVVLAGNPNVGKSSVFNALTGLRQKVANYPGVTVERREGTLDHGGRRFRIIDLPGTYSLVSRSPDERITADVLAGRIEGVPPPDVAVVVIEASNVRRGLFLLSQVMDLGLPLVVCLNMVDEAARAGNPVDARRLSSALGGIPVVETVGSRGHGLDRLRDALLSATPPSPEFQAWREDAAIPPGAGSRWDRLRAADAGGDESSEVAARYAWTQGVVDALRMRQAVTPRRSSDRLDRLLLHPVFGFLAFVLVMGALFQAVFAWAAPITDLVDAGISGLGGWIGGTLEEGIVRDVVADGVIPGIGSVLVFLPQILVLFLLLGILEDTGYMTRAAFIVDRPLRALGLSGRAFIPLLSSFACAIPGIMATRTIDDRRERLLTILVAPLMTCSARLPVYALIIGAFVPDRPLLGPIGLQATVMLALYVGGALAASAAAFVIGRTLLRGTRVAPIIEMPPYRLPTARAVLLRLKHRAGAFLTRAGTVIFAAAVILWALAYFPRAETPKDLSPDAMAQVQLEQSFAGRLGHALEPVVEPLGFDWRVGIGIVSSLAAREVFVATLGVVYAAEDADEAETRPRLRDALRGARHDRSGLRVFDWPTIVALLVFFVIAPQCISTLAVIRRESGSWNWAAFAFVYLTAFAWIAAFAANRITSAIAGAML